MVRDFPRNRMPQGSLWNAVDYIPDNGAALRERGGWGNAASVSAVSATASRIVAGIHGPFASGSQLLAIDDDGLLWKFTTAGTVTLVGTAVLPIQNPVYYGGNVIIPSPGSTTIGKKYDGTTISDIAASAPPGKYAAVFKDYVVLAGSDANPRRQWFSAPGAPGGTWDTTYSIIDYSRDILGMAALKNAILVFHKDQTSRIRGSTPPSSSGTGDFQKDDPAFNLGLLDARSIVVYQDWAYFASPKGVFRSDGVSVDDLTQRGGMYQYWQDVISQWQGNFTVAGGIFNNTYLLVINNETVLIDAFMINLSDYSWTRWSNTDAHTFWNSVDTLDEIYWGSRGSGVVRKGSSMWTPTSSVKNDGNGTAVTAVMESPFYEGTPGLKRIRSIFVGSELTDWATDNPTATVSYITTPEATSYTALADTIAESTAYQRTRHPIGGHYEGIAVKISRTNAGNMKIYSLEAEIAAEEPGRRV